MQNTNFRLPSLLVFLTLSFLSSCTFLYIPPIIEAEVIAERLNIEGSRGLFLENDELSLSVQLNRIPHEGWLNVQWYAQTNEEVASDAFWLTRSNEGYTLSYGLPSYVDLAEGTWRAVLSFEGQLLRQFSIDIISNNRR